LRSSLRDPCHLSVTRRHRRVTRRLPHLWYDQTAHLGHSGDADPCAVGNSLQPQGARGSGPANTIRPANLSAARRSWGPSWRQAGVPCGVAEGSEDPWLCGPGFRRVCLCRGVGTTVGAAYQGCQRLHAGETELPRSAVRPNHSASDFASTPRRPTAPRPAPERAECARCRGHRPGGSLGP
jgi:hypothetical protein